MIRNHSRFAVSAILGFVSALGAASSARAEIIPVVNFGFEEPVLSDGSWTASNVTGWSVLASGAFNPTVSNFPGGAPEGQNTGFVNAGYLHQDLAAHVLQLGTYTLRVDVGNRLDSNFPGYRVQLLAGSTVLAEDNNSLSPSEGAFLTSEVEFTATASDPMLGATLAVRLVSAGVQTNFDNVRLDFAPVPEPPSAVLLGSCALGLLAFGRRRWRVLQV